MYEVWDRFRFFFCLLGILDGKGYRLWSHFHQTPNETAETEVQIISKLNKIRNERENTETSENCG